MAATKSKRRKPTREQLKPGECLCDFCTGVCCRYFSLPINNPTTWDEYDTIRWYLAHGQTVIYVEKEQWYLLVMTRCQYLTARQPLRHLSQSPQDLPRIHDRQLRIRWRLVVRKDLRDPGADLGVCRGRAAATAKTRWCRGDHAADRDNRSVVRCPLSVVDVATMNRAESVR